MYDKKIAGQQLRREKNKIKALIQLSEELKSGLGGPGLVEFLVELLFYNILLLDKQKYSSEQIAILQAKKRG